MKEHLKKVISLAVITYFCYQGLQTNEPLYIFGAYYLFGAYVLYLLWSTRLFHSIKTRLRDGKRSDTKEKKCDHYSDAKR